MLTTEKFIWRGRIRARVWRAGTLIRDDRFDNLITTVGRNMVRDMLAGDVSDGQIKYVAVGSDATAPAAGNTALGTETFRKQVTDRSQPGIGQILTSLFLATADANAQIEEIGWFAGTSASATTDSGILVARVLWSHLKTNLETIQIDRTDQFQGV